jgi:hypothetical protein
VKKTLLMEKIEYDIARDCRKDEENVEMRENISKKMTSLKSNNIII